ncbi:hypothetical protein HY251_09660, partial [bacterium]|nr:hypothetical protein [bacterium]
MKRHSSWAAVVLAAVAVPFLLPAALRGESPLDKDYVKARSAVDDLAALGLFWIARDYASHGFKERADEVGKAALEIASDAKKKEIKAALSKPPAKRDAPEDSKLFEARLERDVDHCVVRGVRRYQKLAA